MRFRDMSTCETEELVPFLILRHGNGVADFVVQQVSIFEGQMYPDAADGCVDWGDRITDAIGWYPLDDVQPPETITIEAGRHLT